MTLCFPHVCLGLCGSPSRIHGDKQPVWFTLGIKEGIKGWDKGLQDMCAGEKRRLVIPPALAYGKEGRGILHPHTHMLSWAHTALPLSFTKCVILSILCMIVHLIKKNCSNTMLFWMAFQDFYAERGLHTLISAQLFLSMEHVNHTVHGSGKDKPH